MQVKDLQLKRALRTALFVLLLGAGMKSFAERVEPGVARAVATTFLNNNGVRSNLLTDMSESAGFSNLYIFSGEQGFVVMAADDRVKPILGYSLTDQFVVENMPENLRWWLQGYNDEIQYAVDNQIRVSSEVASEWEGLKNGESNRTVMTTIVAPLIQSTWGQGDGYNDRCPYDYNADERTLTGCVATAMAQIMRYWAHPLQGKGYHSYEPDTHPEYGTQQVNFGVATYDWSNMPLDYANSEIAKLMYHCGVSVSMDYGISGSPDNGSSAYDYKVPYALKTYFGYSGEVVNLDKDQYDNDVEWILMMKEELDAGRPMLYGGQSSNDNSIAVGHAFVCDGYDSNYNFHFNWGWDGDCQNSYFSIYALTPDESYNFSFKQDVVLGIQPVVVIGDLKYALSKSTAKVVGHIDGTSASGSLTIPSSVTYTNALGQTRTYEVVAIGNNAFSGCSGLTGTLTIPNSITSIGDNAFGGCSGFTGSLIIPNSITFIGSAAFYNCIGFTDSLTIPHSVTIISSYAFYGCSNFSTIYYNPQACSYNYEYYFGNAYPFVGCGGSLVIGDNVESIPKYMFKNGEFTIVYYNPTNCADAYSGHSPFSGCGGSLVIGDNVERIPKCMFQDGGFTGTLTIGPSVLSIGEEAFANCSGFSTIYYNPTNCADCFNLDSPFSGCGGSLVIGDNVERIPAFMFQNVGFTGNLTIPNSVTSIGFAAFNNCSSFTGSLIIPSSVISIGGDAFGRCSGLSTLYYYPTNCADPSDIAQIGNHIVSGSSPFSFCGGSLVIGDYVERIPAKMFRNADFTGDLTIPNSVTEIGEYAFYGCSGFDGSLTIGTNVVSIQNAAFSYTGFTTLNFNASNCESISVGSYYSDYLYAFYNCSSLSILNIGNQVYSIPSCAFENCSFFTGSLIIPNSVTTIGSSAFSGCSGFTGSLIIPNSVTTIDSRAFSGCSGFTGSLTIPNTVTSIGSEAFSGCSGISTIYYNPINCSDAPSAYNGKGVFTDCGETLVIGDNVQRIPANMFSHGNFTGNLTIPNSVTTIDSRAFSGCSSFTGDLVLPNSLTTIGDDAFHDCSGFTGELVIPNSVTTIGFWAFWGCSGFTGNLTIGNSVTTIGNYAFGSTNFQRIKSITQQPPATYADAFYNVNKAVPVNVPCGSQESYKAAMGWSKFTNITGGDYYLLVSPNSEYRGNASITQNGFCEDEECVVFAYPYLGNIFMRWTRNGETVSTEQEHHFTLTEDMALVAEFQPLPNHRFFVGGSSTNHWDDPANWYPTEIPTESTTVSICDDAEMNVDANASSMTIFNDKVLTIKTGKTLIVSETLESPSASSIIIEDGGQIVHANEGALATVKKSIESYTNDADGWNLISFPLTGNGNVASIENMLSNQYDLYSYNEPTHYWMNQKEEDNGFTALEAGMGYLYANKGTGIGSPTGSNIGEGTSTIGYTPFYTYYEYSIAENLFLASELEAAGLPTTALGGLCWYATNQTGYLQSNISIWMANVNDDALTTTSHNVSGMTLVYTGEMTPVVGWNSFVFNENNFTWDGTSNVLVCVQRNNGTYYSTIYWQAHNPGFASTSYKYNISSAYDMTSETYSMNVSSSLRPNTIFQTLEQVGEYEYYEPITLSFAGEMENGAAMVTVPLSYTETAGNLRGFNLVGNPFVHNVTTYASTNVAAGCFRLNETKDNLIVSEVSETLPLKPAEGFFVKATGENASIIFNPGRLRGETKRKGFVNLELREGGKLIDRLIVKREGDPLEKLTLKENGTRLFATQNKQEVAIVSCDDNEQPVNFKATKNGSYMITASLDNMAVDFLHLIDNLTGADVDLLALRQAQGPMSYTFEAKTTDYDSRFKLVFSVSGDENDEDAPFAFINNGNIIIVGAEDGALLQIVDVTGRILVSRMGDAMNRVSTNGMSPGVYVLRLINGEEVKTQKIVVE